MTEPENMPKRTTKAIAALSLVARVQRMRIKREATVVTTAWTLTAPKLRMISRGVFFGKDGKDRKYSLVAEPGRADAADCAGDVHDAEEPEGTDGVLLDFLFA